MATIRSRSAAARPHRSGCTKTCSAGSSRGSKRSDEPAEKSGSDSTEIGGPFVTAVERGHDDGRPGCAKPALVVSKLLRRVPVIPLAAAKKSLRDTRERLRLEIGRHVAAERNDAAGLMTAKCSGPKRHGHALRKPCEDGRRAVTRCSPDLIDDGGEIREVVGDHHVTILVRHPAGDDVAGAASIEAV